MELRAFDKEMRKLLKRISKGEVTIDTYGWKAWQDRAQAIRDIGEKVVNQSATESAAQGDFIPMNDNSVEYRKVQDSWRRVTWVYRLGGEA